MAERPGDGVDPDATVAMPALKPESLAGSGPDPDATISIPVATVQPDPGPIADPEATFSGPVLDITEAFDLPPPVAEPDPDATDPMARSPFYQPPLDADATVAMAAPASLIAEPDPEATIAIPTPGRLRSAPANPAMVNPFAPKPGRDATQADIGALGGLNPLVEAANPILGAVPHLRHALRHPNPGRLRDSLAEQLETFEAAAAIAGVAEDTIQVARHALCALLDESASRTPWGASWAQSGLVRLLLDGDTSGARFFEDVERARTAPEANADLLEFFYACLALGYEGKYRDAEDGATALASLRQRLYDQVRARRPLPADGDLSPRWRGAPARARELPGALLLWGLASVVALVLVGLYLALGASLGGLSDPVARDLAQLRLPAPAAAASTAAGVPTPGAIPVARVAPLLADAIQRGQVVVTEDANSSTIVVRSDRLFASGSARLEPGLEPVVTAIADALARVPGAIVVTGHTDDVPIRSARFQSNWELSTARAQSVVKLVAAKLPDPGRLMAEGLADSQPVAPNDSEANRARNRRVVIILRSTP